MGIALVIFATLLVVASAGSAVAKLKKAPDVMASMASVGVSPGQVRILALLEIAGALGLVAGVWIAPLGVLSATCLALYFVGAVASHIRKSHKVAEFAPAAGILVIAVITTLLEVVR